MLYIVTCQAHPVLVKKVNQVCGSFLLKKIFHLSGYLVCLLLRLHASYDAKITKNPTPWYVLLDYFITRSFFKNLNVPFLTKWP